MIWCARSPALLLLLVVTSGGILPWACVNTGSSNKSSAGGQPGSMGGGGSPATTTGGYTSSAAGSCADKPDTANDGMAGTTSTGPYQWKSVTIRGGGFVDGIIFSHVNQDLVYARTDIGSACRWDPAMNGWVALTDWVSESH